MALLSIRRRPLRLILLVLFAFTILYLMHLENSLWTSHTPLLQSDDFIPSGYDWSKRRQKYPVENEFVHPPTGTPKALPKIQHNFSTRHNWTQEQRRREVLKSFKSCWALYRQHAWGRDALKPNSLTGDDIFGSWGATLVDSLDSLWILGLKNEFNEAITVVAKIDWDRVGASESVSLFETNIRYLGGLLSAYDLSKANVLLRKAVELGDMLYNGFDTPLRMPATDFHFQKAKDGQLLASDREISANVGSFSLEFTRLSQLTGDPKYFDAIDRIKHKLQETQMQSKLPGLWPKIIDVANGFLVGNNDFTMGSMADSVYEYLPKMHMLLGGLDDSYHHMYLKAASAAKNHLLFRPMLPDRSVQILFSGNAFSNGAGSVEKEYNGQHLACFIGGMFALGSRLFTLTDDMDTAAQLTRGCAWAYKVMPTHVMPEAFELIACKEPALGRCYWDENRWRLEGNVWLPRGFKSVHLKGYALRPEAIESVFYMWRITGDEVWRDTAWEMFVAIRRLTETKSGANSAVNDVTRGDALQLDSMEVSYYLPSFSPFLSMCGVLTIACCAELLAFRDPQVLLPDLL